MARNDERRSRLADAGLQVLAEQGARGLTHRAVDVAAGLPLGTASNYFRSRDDLVAGPRRPHRGPARAGPDERPAARSDPARGAGRAGCATWCAG
ncbi:MAG: TetR family transcriptional regulator [Aeromicrobium erythreum]